MKSVVQITLLVLIIQSLHNNYIRHVSDKLKGIHVMNTNKVSFVTSLTLIGWLVLSTSLWLLSGEGYLSFCFPYGTPLGLPVFLLGISVIFIVVILTCLRRRLAIWAMILSLACCLLAIIINIIYANEILYVA